MRSFTKQLIFILLAGVILTASALIIKGATPSGKLKINPNLTAKVKMVKQENTTTTGNNPVGWWKMDEGTGQYAYDVSGNGNTGTLGTSTVADGADPTWTTGKLGKGLSFDGVNDWVSVPNSATLANLDANANSYSFSVWVKSSSPGSNYRIFEKGTTNYPVSWQGNATTLGAYVYDGAVAPSVTFGNIWNGNWRFLTFVVDYPTDKLYSYLDGVLIVSTTNTVTATTANTAVLYIANRVTGDRTFNGIIDDVRIYNRALSAGEVRQMYNSTKDGYLGNIKVSTGLVGYWKLDDNNALTSVIDYSGKGNTGTAYSGTATSTSVLSTSTAMIGRAMSFDGVGRWVDAGNGASLQIPVGGKITMSAWVKLNALPSQWANIACKYFAYNGLGVQSDGALVFHTAGQNYVNRGNTAALSWDFNTWYHIVAVYDDALLNVKFYRNGVLIATTKNPTVPIAIYANNLLIGKGVGTSYYFNGLIDEVKIWNYARTAEQIHEDYVRGTLHLP